MPDAAFSLFLKSDKKKIKKKIFFIKALRFSYFYDIIKKFISFICTLQQVFNSTYIEKKNHNF